MLNDAIITAETPSHDERMGNFNKRGNFFFVAAAVVGLNISLNFYVGEM